MDTLMPQLTWDQSLIPSMRTHAKCYMNNNWTKTEQKHRLIQMLQQKHLDPTYQYHFIVPNGRVVLVLQPKAHHLIHTQMQNKTAGTNATLILKLRGQTALHLLYELEIDTRNRTVVYDCTYLKTLGSSSTEADDDKFRISMDYTIYPLVGGSPHFYDQLAQLVANWTLMSKVWTTAQVFDCMYTML